MKKLLFLLLSIAFVFSGISQSLANEGKPLTYLELKLNSMRSEIQWADGKWVHIPNSQFRMISLLVSAQGNWVELGQSSSRHHAKISQLRQILRAIAPDDLHIESGGNCSYRLTLVNTAPIEPLNAKIEIDPLAQSVTINDKQGKFTSQEISALEVFVAHKGSASNDELARGVWDVLEILPQQSWRIRKRNGDTDLLLGYHIFSLISRLKRDLKPFGYGISKSRGHRYYLQVLNPAPRYCSGEFTGTTFVQ